MNEVLNYAEGEARANAAFHIANAEALTKESHVFLTLLLTGAGGSVAYLVNLAEKSAPLWQLAGIGAAGAYLFIVAALVI